MGLACVKQSSVPTCERVRSDSVIKIEIAGICVALRSDNAKFIEQVEKRYEGFLSTGDPLVTVDVLITDRLKNNASRDMLISLVDNRISLSYYGQTVGYVDVEQGVGQLEMIPYAPLNSLCAIENFLRVLYSFLCVRNNGLLLHASGIVKDNKAHIFLGHSGSGKTTVCRLSSGHTILGDDLVIVRAMNGVWRAFGTPFWIDVPEGAIANESAEIKGFFGLVQDTKVHFEKLNRPRAVAKLTASVPLVYKDLALGKDLIRLCSHAVREIPCYRMHFLPDDSFWRYIDELT